jgi:DNA-binding IclR family transcriptional regulator
LDANEVVYLACHNTSAPLGFTFRIGMRLPALFTATGKAMLAQLSDDELNRILPSTWPSALTTHSVRSRKRLKEELAASVVRGFAIDDGQVREGMLCLGAAIIDAQGRPSAGLALSMTSAEATPTVIARQGAAIVAMAQALSQGPCCDKILTFVKSSTCHNRH